MFLSYLEKLFMSSNRKSSLLDNHLSPATTPHQEIRQPLTKTHIILSGFASNVILTW